MTSQRALRPRAVLLLLALVAGVLVAPASAGSPGAQLSLAGQGPGWTAATVVTDGAAVTSELLLAEVDLPAQIGYRVYDGDLAPAHAGTVTFLAGDQGVVVQSSGTLPGVDLDYDGMERGATTVPSVRATLSLNKDQAGLLRGVFTVLVWVASGGAGASTWTVKGGSGTALRGSTSGSRVFVATARDFRGALNVQAANRGAAVRAQYATRLTRRIEGTFVGSFGPVLTSADSMAVDTPQGTRPCVPSCTFSSVTGPSRAGAGTYGFSLTGGGVGGILVNAADVVAGGADVRLP